MKKQRFNVNLTDADHTALIERAKVTRRSAAAEAEVIISKALKTPPTV